MRGTVAKANRQGSGDKVINDLGFQIHLIEYRREAITSCGFKGKAGDNIKVVFETEHRPGIE
jgi:hypothetical protein